MHDCMRINLQAFGNKVEYAFVKVINVVICLSEILSEILLEISVLKNISNNINLIVQ